MKEKSALYYRRKCEQFLGDIDKLVNAKISQKGGQLLYELDVASRELRVLRDNYRLMQKMMTQELRHEYLRAIQERDDKLRRLGEAFSDEQQRVSKATIVDVQSEFRDLVEKVEKKGAEATNNGPAFSSFSRPQPGAAMRPGPAGGRPGLAQPAILVEQEERKVDAGHFEADAMREVLGLQRFIRKHKAF
jgi:hypothetical protein